MTALLIAVTAIDTRLVVGQPDGLVFSASYGPDEVCKERELYRNSAEMR